VLARNADEAGVAVGAGGGLQRRDAPVARRQAGRDPVERPGAAQVQGVDVGQLGIGAIGDDARPQPRRRGVRGDARQEPRQPRGEGRRREYPPEQIGLRQARREEILAEGLVDQGAVAILLVVRAGARFDEPRQP